MVDTYETVLDRIGAFNAATEAMTKRRAHEVTFAIRDRPQAL